MESPTGHDAALHDEVRQLRERLERAEALIERLTTSNPAPATPAPAASPLDQPTDRRHLLKQAGLAAGVAAVGIAAGVAGATPAAANTGDALILGNGANVAQNVTKATNATTTDAHMFHFSDSYAFTPVDGGIGTLTGFAGFADAAVMGISTKTSGSAVRAQSSGTNGVAVSGNATGYGSIGVTANGNSIGLAATGGTTGVRTLMSVVDDNAGVSVLGGRRGVQVSSCALPLSIIPSAYPSGPPTSLGYSALVGDVFVDGDGVLYHCTAGGDPGTWQRISGQGTAGALTVTNPTRVYDSRLATGKLHTGQSRLLSVANGINVTTGAVSTPNVVPDGATAIHYNLTITETEGSGYLQVSPNLYSTSVTASSINWTGNGQTIANGLLVKIAASRQVNVIAGGAGGATHFVIDVVGYHR